ncbi:MAG: hypothetical protein Q9177_006084, partial [Variospora cf. flavescens]
MLAFPLPLHVRAHLDGNRALLEPWSGNGPGRREVVDARRHNFSDGRVRYYGPVVVGGEVDAHAVYGAGEAVIGGGWEGVGER